MAAPIGPDQCGELFARQLAEQADVCAKIMALSERQRKIVEERREGELLELLADKQRLIDRHETLMKKTQELRERWERARARAATRDKVEKAWERLRDVLNEVVRLEDASRAMLQDAKDKVSRDINRIQRGKIANKAYGGGRLPPPQARFSDRKG
ncbi:MAG: flagellar export chaperone FlgN [Planctomycetota bacterium]|jgi:PHP family Zn ribbon phosphoesterase|nr:flagellar export chaperone FlgN [Planctomycetota bacterium]